MMTGAMYLNLLNEDPKNVLKAEYGDYEYQPISHIKNELDRVFGGEWSFDIDRETIGKGEAIAKGTLTYRHPVTGYEIVRSGTAALPLSKGLRLDYPKLAAAVLANAAKTIGRRFGRDLNKDKDDIPIVVVDKTQTADEEFESVKKEVQERVQMHGAANAKAYLQTTPFRFHPELNSFLK